MHQSMPSDCVCAHFLIAQAYWTESGGVYFAGTPLDRDVSAPFSVHTPEEHRYSMVVLPRKPLTFAKHTKRERIRALRVEGVVEIHPEFLNAPKTSSSCSNCVVCS